MTMQVPASQRPIRYPTGDGKPIAENTLQFRWIVTIEVNLEAMFRHNPTVFVAGDLFWYPVEGRPDICTAPDALVVFGRQKGHRGSYKQWEEDGIAPQVVFEVLSPSNRSGEMIRKFRFYERYGVEEYYIYDPNLPDLSGWQRSGSELVEIPQMNGWISPRLGIRFDTSGPELAIFRPDGKPFLTFVELMQQAEEEGRRADEEKQRADEERLAREQAQRRADEERRRAETLAERLRALGINPDEIQGPT